MTDVVMPQMGESIVEGTLTKWLKKPGERIERDEPLFEISTDKVDTEIPSPAAGTLAEILVEEGKTVGINTVVARIDEAGGAAVGAVKPVAAPAEPMPPAPAAPPPAPPAVPPAAPGPRETPSAGPGGPPARRSALSAGPQDGARAQSRSDAGEGHRRRRPDYQAGRGSLRRGTFAARDPARRAAGCCAANRGPASRRPATARRSGQDPHRTDEHHAHQNRRTHGD